MHREALRLAGLEGDYQIVKADSKIFERIVGQLRDAVLDGVNVTMPLKRHAFEVADVVSDDAAAGTTVNTLRSRDGSIEATSTDISAFKEVHHEGPILILGAGGSARAAMAAWRDLDLTVSARNQSKARQLAEMMGGRVLDWGERLPGAVVVNATPLGMNGESIPLEVLADAAGLIDLPYGSVATPAVTYAKARGIPVVDGLEFLGRQAAACFEWWTGFAVDSKYLVDAVRNV